MNIIGIGGPIVLQKQIKGFARPGWMGAPGEFFIATYCLLPLDGRHPRPGVDQSKGAEVVGNLVHQPRRADENRMQIATDAVLQPDDIPERLARFGGVE